MQTLLSVGSPTEVWIHELIFSLSDFCLRPTDLITVLKGKCFMHNSGHPDVKPLQYEGRLKSAKINCTHVFVYCGRIQMCEPRLCY
jgi:hypothetical protein